jgi:hypothetical protein
VASKPILKERLAARIAIVEEHVRLENEHDLEGVLRTFGDTARYDDEPWGEHYQGRKGVRSFYKQLMTALPDLQIEVQRQHVTDDSIGSKSRFAALTLVDGVVFPRPGGESSAHSAEFTRSTAMIVWPAKKSITTGARC